ncbi:MAG: hypothetical protein ICV54_26740 [Nostoc sp. C3-bin3]|nr:hypothetical protein [Nostoc sp. C3-bin3]
MKAISTVYGVLMDISLKDLRECLPLFEVYGNLNVSRQSPASAEGRVGKDSG